MLKFGFCQDFDEDSEVEDDPESPILLPFSLYFELSNAIKNSGRKESPHIRIKISFDKLQLLVVVCIGKAHSLT